MRRPLFSIAAASVLMAGVGLAYGQSTTSTTTTWTNDEGSSMREYSRTEHYKSYDDPAMRPQAGVEIPSSVTLYPLPKTVEIPSSENYSYGIINNNPVVVERTTRRVVHTWE
jgi:Protein of unknown function (DUF1236)